MIAGTLEIQMLANMARLTEDMAKAKGIVGDAVRGIESLLGAIGLGFSADMLLEKINSVVEGMDRLRLSSEKTGASVEALSQLQFFAGVSGSNIDSVTGALVKLSKAEAAAGNDAAPATQALKFLGLSAKDAAGNLKDPSVLYGEIALQLSAYADGAGKTALAVALMGKAGAEQLPAMKALVEIGPVETSVTTAQAEAAKEYALQVALLNRQKEILWNTLATALLPTMKTVVEALIAASKETDSLSSSAKKLATEGSVESWADATAMGIARVIDVARTLIGIFSQIEAPMERYFRASQAGFAAISIQMGPGTSAEKDQALTMLREETAAINKELQKRFADGSFWTAKLNTQTSDALAAAIAARKAASPPGTGPWSGPVDQFGQPITKTQANFDSTGGKAGGRNAAAYAAYIKAQQDALDKTMHESIATAQLLLNESLAHNLVSYEDYYTQREVLERKDAALKISTIQTSMVAEQQSIIAAATPAAKYTAMAKLATLQGNLNKAQEDESRIGAKTVLDYTDAWRKYYLERNTLQQQLLTGEGKAVEAYVIGLDKQWTDELRKMEANSDTAGIEIAHSLIQTGLVTAQLADVTTLFGRSQAELVNQEKAITLESSRGVISEFAGRQQILALRRSFLPEMAAELEALNLIDKAAMTPEQIQRAVALKQALAELGTAASDVNRTFAFGAKNAMGEYEDAATNAAANAKTAFADAFKGMEDALFNFTQTGKLDFKSLANSIMADIARIAVRQGITGPLAKSMGSSDAFSTIAGWFSGGGAQSGAAATAAASSLPEGFLSLAGVAGGGPVTGGTPYMVGERGPELFVPDTSGTIIPNGQNGQTRLNVTNVFQISGPTDTRTQAQIAAAAGQGISRAMARNT